MVHYTVINVKTSIDYPNSLGKNLEMPSKRRIFATINNHIRYEEDMYLCGQIRP